MLWSRAGGLEESGGAFPFSWAHSFVRPAPRAFFRPDRPISQPSRAGPVKVGRRSAVASCSVVSRPRLDWPEHGGMLDRLGLQGAVIRTVTRGTGWPAFRPRTHHAAASSEEARGGPWRWDQVFFFSPARRRRLSPLSSMRWALCTMRSNIASARVGSAMMSCHCASGTWLVIRSDPLS